MLEVAAALKLRTVRSTVHFSWTNGLLGSYSRPEVGFGARTPFSREFA